jgi:hypothetical protein
MNKLPTIAVLSAVLVTGSASAQMVDPALSRDIGRAVGEAAVAAERAADEAKIAAREAMRAARQGYAEAGGRHAGRAYARPLVATEDAAVDACAVAAEQRGYDQGFRAVVRDIDGVERRPDGWDVDGVLDARRGWRDRPDSWSFRCSVRHGEVIDVDLGQDFAAR